MQQAKNVAAYLVHLAENDPSAKGVTHMSLQKILYYVQGWSWAWRGEPMFSERFEAWRHGPVVPHVWSSYRDCGRDRIPDTQGRRACLEDDADQDFIKSIWNSYKNYTPAQLRYMTHQETPWIEARGDRPENAECSQQISEDSIRDYFCKKVNAEVIPGLEPEHFQRAKEDFKNDRSVTLDDLIAGLPHVL